MTVAAGLRAFHYAEFDDKRRELDRETGYLPWLAVGASWQFAQRWQLAAAWQVATGTVRYDGETWGGLPHKTDTNLTEQRVQLKLGWRPPEMSGQIYTLLGYYWRDREIQPGNGVVGMGEIYRWGQAGLGMEQPLTTWLVVNLQAAWAVSPQLDINLASTPTMRLPSFVELQTGADVGLGCNALGCWSLTARYRRADIQASRYVWSGSMAASIHEPASQQSSWDLGIRLQF